MSHDDHNATVNDLIRGHQAAKNAQAARVFGFAEPAPLEQARSEAREALGAYQAAEGSERERLSEGVDAALDRVRELTAEQDAPPPPDFGGGARTPPPPPPPSMGSLLLAEIEEARERKFRRATQLDDLNY